VSLPTFYSTAINVTRVQVIPVMTSMRMTIDEFQTKQNLLPEMRMRKEFIVTVPREKQPR
jgi:hypothetical protein